MAIKTKKIAELSEITSNGSFLLGQNGNVTGKISYSSIMNEVDEKITTAIASIPTTDEDTSTNEDTVTNDRFISLSNKVENNTTQILSIDKRQANLESVVVSSTEKSLLLEQKAQELSEKVAALEVKVAALEGFVKALQEEGYLTLAKIKQAAADNCPICNHEHSEVTEEPRPEYPTPEQPTV